MPTIRLDDDVFNGLKSLAEPFTDTPNSVIRRLLQERGTLAKGDNSESVPGPAQTKTSSTVTGGRSQTGGLISQSTYEKYLLHVLAMQFKGRGNKPEVTREVIKLLESRGLLGEADRVHVSSGETRAENTIAWGRNALKERGLISQTSPRGIWELTDRGMKEGRASAV